MVHPVAEDALAALGHRLGGLGRAHHRGQAGGHADGRFPGLADAGRILGRDPAAVLDRLALAEQIGLLLAGGLLGRQPLQRAGVGRALVVDDQPLRCPGAARRPAARRASGRRRRPCTGAAGLSPSVMLSISRPLSSRMISFASGLRSMSSVAVPPIALGVEIDREVERDMVDARLERPGVAARRPWRRACQDRRDRPLAGRSPAVPAMLVSDSLAGGKRQERPRQRPYGTTS